MTEAQNQLIQIIFASITNIRFALALKFPFNKITMALGFFAVEQFAVKKPNLT